MTQKLQQMRRVPRRIRLVSALFLCSGILVLFVSIGIMLLGVALMSTIDEGKLLRDDEGSFSQMFGGGVLIIGGLAGIFLGSLTILAGVGLRRMKRWGLWFSYIAIVLWLLVDLVVLLIFGIVSKFLIINLAVVTISILCVVIGVYLVRMRTYFER
jgi:hypothetical protein